MSFQLKRSRAVGEEVKRIVRHQIDRALEVLRTSDGDDQAVHDARKRFKKVRAVLRLVRDELGDKVYQRENAHFRDLGRPLTAVRDARVLLDALGRLNKHFADELQPRAFHAVRRGLRANQQAIRQRVLDEEKAFAVVSAGLEEAQDRVRGGHFRHRGWSALRRGLRRVYEQGATALEAARADPSVEKLHEWRKQAKYLWHQLQVLVPVWPPVMESLAEQVHELTQHLGDDHDLAVLRATVASAADEYGGPVVVETLEALIDRRRAELQAQAFPLGRRIYRDGPKEFTRRIRGYWKAWRRESGGVSGS